MLLEASEEGVEGNWDGGRIVWSVRYAFEGEEDNGSQLNGMDQLQQRLQQRQMQHHHHHHSERRKLQARLEIQKDDIQAVLPISKVRSSLMFLIRDIVEITKTARHRLKYYSCSIVRCVLYSCVT